MKNHNQNIMSKRIITLFCLLLTCGVNAQSSKNLLIIEGYFFKDMPIAKTEISRIYMLNTPADNTAIGLELKTPLPEEAIQYAIPIENVNEGTLLLELYNEAKAKEKGMSVTLNKTSTIKEGDKFPEFSATDINGKTWTNDDANGKVMVLNLWFTGCRPCRAEMPELSKWKDEMPDVMFFSSTYEDAERAKPILEKQQFNWIALINDTQFTQYIGYNGYPMTIVADKSGIVKRVEHGTSPTQLADLKALIQSLRE